MGQMRAKQVRLREIELLRKLSHENVVTLEEEEFEVRILYVLLLTLFFLKLHQASIIPDCIRKCELCNCLSVRGNAQKLRMLHHNRNRLMHAFVALIG